MAGLQGRVFAGYALGDQLGSAGIAEVYRARPTKPGGREAVVKVIYPEFARQPGFVPHFRQIVQSTSKLASHPHILPMLASGEEAGYLYLITPFVAGGTLNDWIVRGGRMGPADIGPFFRQLCEALGYAHSLGVVHGNVKPSNVFLYEGRHVMLGDFGMLWDVAHMDVNHAGSGGDVLEYMAPEVMQGQVSPLSDVYSTGAVIFASIAGAPPFRGPRPADVLAAHAQQPVPHLAQVNPTLPPPMLALDIVTQRALAKRPEQRFPSAAALAQSIETTIRQAAQGAAPGIAAPMAPAYSPPQLGAPANVIPPLGAGLNQAAAAFFNPPPAPSYEPPSLSIRPAGQQFPPLPPSATVDESMDRGGAALRQPEMYQPSGPPIVYEPTNRMDAMPYSAPSGPRSAPSVPPDATNQADDMWAGPLDAADGGMRGAWSLGRPRSGLGKRLGQPGAPQLSEPQAQYYSEDSYDGGSIPAVRGPAAGAVPPAPGFSVAGGANGWDHPPTGGESHSGPQLSESQELAAWVASGDDAAAGGDSGEVRAFSPTQLGLPRLTSPSLSSMPPSWQEIISAPVPSADDPRRWHPSGGSNSGPDIAMPHTPWRSDPKSGEDEWADRSGDWTGPNSGAVGWMVSGAQAQVSGGAPKNLAHWDDVNQIPREDDLRFDTKFAKKGRLRVRGKPGMAPRLLLLLLLLVIADIGAVEIARPDLCPISACASISDKLHKALPFLPALATPAPAVVNATPSSMQISIPAEQTASAPLVIANATTTSLDWHVTVGFDWITISPASGTIGVGSSANLTVSAKPKGIGPGPHNTTITVTTARGNVTIPITITVTTATSATSTPTASYIGPGGATSASTA